MIYTIDELKQKIAPIAVKYNIPAVYIFGSFARGKATDNSDLDFLVDLDSSKIRTLFDMGGLYNDLSETFGEDIDLITTDALSNNSRTPWFAKNVLEERVAIYGE